MEYTPTLTTTEKIKLRIAMDMNQSIIVVSIEHAGSVYTYVDISHQNNLRKGIQSIILSDRSLKSLYYLPPLPRSILSRIPIEAGEPTPLLKPPTAKEFEGSESKAR